MASQPRFTLELPPMEMPGPPPGLNAPAQKIPSSTIAAVADVVIVGAVDRKSEEKPSSFWIASVTWTPSVQLADVG